MSDPDPDDIAAQLQVVTVASHLIDDVLGTNAAPMTDALAEFKAAAREAHRTQKAAQAAAQRYAAAVKRLSEVVVADE